MTIKKAPIQGAPICFDYDLLATAEAAQRTLDERSQELLRTFVDRCNVAAAMSEEDIKDVRARVREEDAEELEALKKAWQEAQDALAGVTRIYQFRSLGYKAWRALKAAHPSKDPELAFDEDSIAPTLLREASHDPKLTAEMVEEILSSPDWSEGEVRLLLRAAVGAQS